MERQSMTITISRQMGSDGTLIGRKVAEFLGFSYIDREILRQTANLLNRDEIALEEYDGKSSGFIQNLLRTFVLGTPETSTYMAMERPIYDSDLFALESKIMKEIVARGNTVIIGRAGFSVLKGRPETVHLFIYAPADYRVNQMMKSEDITNLRQAQAKVEESDRRRTKFIKDMVGTDWTDAQNYNLCIDSSIMDVNKNVQMVTDFVKTALSIEEGAKNT